MRITLFYKIMNHGLFQKIIYMVCIILENQSEKNRTNVNINENPLKILD